MRPSVTRTGRRWEHPGSNPRPGDTNFTPPFPAYTSGHATFGAAAFETMENFFGRDDIQFSFISDEFNGITRDADGSTRPVASRTFDSFSEAKEENGQSRIYLGIHWAFDKNDGIKTGDETADYIFANALQSKSPLSDPLRHNTFDPADVNDDGQCSALDALLIVNILNEGRVVSTNFIDVNNDDFVTPLDALLIVNRLNSSTQVGITAEGEAQADESPFSLITIDRGSVVAPADKSDSLTKLARPNAPPDPVPVGELPRTNLTLSSRSLRSKPAADDLGSIELADNLPSPLVGFYERLSHPFGLNSPKADLHSAHDLGEGNAATVAGNTCQRRGLTTPEP